MQKMALSDPSVLADVKSASVALQRLQKKLEAENGSPFSQIVADIRSLVGSGCASNVCFDIW